MPNECREIAVQLMMNREESNARVSKGRLVQVVLGQRERERVGEK